MWKSYRLVATMVLLNAVLFLSPLYAQSLGLKVAGQDVTKENAADILAAIGIGEGKMWYDEATRTLTLENVTMDSERKNAIESSTNLTDFTINLIGYNTLTMKGAARMMLRAPKNKITGKGTLDVSSPWTQGIFVDVCDLEISGGCTVIAKGSWGICSDSNYGKLTINASKVVAEGEFGSICDFEKIELIDCVITAPANSYADGGAVTDDMGNTRCDQVVIEKIAAAYDLTVNGVKVDENNAGNILGNETAEYQPDTKTLFLRNANLNTADGPAIEAGSDIILDFAGVNKFQSEQTAMAFGGSVTFRGRGSVEVTSTTQSAIEVAGNQMEVFRFDGLVAKGKKGIVAAEGSTPMLIITQSYVTTQGEEMSLGGFSSVKMDGCHVFAPENCVIENGTAMVNGAVCTDKVVINNTIEYPIWVAGIPVTSLNYKDVFGDGTVCVDLEKKVITLTDFNFVTTDAAAGLAVQTAMGKTTVVLKGKNVIKTPYLGVICSSDVVFEGNGSLEVDGNSGGLVLQETHVTITEGPKMNIKGNAGILSMSIDKIWGSLTLQGADLTVEGWELGSMTLLENLVMEDCEIVTPKGAVFENNNVMYKGDICRSKIVIQKKTSGIENEEADDYTLAVDGQRLMVNTGKAMAVAVYDLAGRMVAAQTVEGEWMVDLATGAYIVVVDRQAQKVLVP